MENKKVNNEERKANTLSQAIKKVFNKDDGEFTAEKAWLSTTYGTNMVFPVEQRIINKQKDIRSIIKSKFKTTTSGYDNGVNYASYRCVIDIEEDLISHKDEVLKPFVDGGFTVINISECIDGLKGENVFLISWKNVFSKEKKISNQ